MKIRADRRGKLRLAFVFGWAALLLLVFAANVPAAEVVEARVASDEAEFRVVRVAGGLQNPWSVAFLPDGRALVSERPGRLQLLQDGRWTQIEGLPEITAVGQGGLLDIALHPQYERNGWIYFSHAGGSRSNMGTRISRARLSGTRLRDVETIFVMQPGSGAGQHFGSRLVFLPDGTLLFTIGDRGSRGRAQDLGDHAGSTLRINDDGSIPADNPFVRRAGALPEIYTYGNRNAQGMAVQPGTGLVWQHEHGPRGGDEVNIIEGGRNYGWPLITYGEEYFGGEIGGTARPGLEQPLIYWVPSIAPSGMAFYTGSDFPGWKGDLFVGALVGKHLRRLEIEGRRIVRQEVLLLDTLGRIRDVRQGPDGYLYLLTDARDGGLYRLEPVGGRVALAASSGR
jgi:glucose/arabinose dehydrogenase